MLLTLLDALPDGQATYLTSVVVQRDGVTVVYSQSVVAGNVTAALIAYSSSVYVVLPVRVGTVRSGARDRVAIPLDTTQTVGRLDTTQTGGRGHGAVTTYLRRA